MRATTNMPCVEANHKRCDASDFSTVAREISGAGEPREGQGGADADGMQPDFRAWAEAESHRLAPYPDYFRSVFFAIVDRLNDQGYVDGTPTDLTQLIGARRNIITALNFLCRMGLLTRQGRRRTWIGVRAPLQMITNEKAAKIVGDQRERILARDGYRCRACGGTKRLCVDHIVAWSCGGQNDDDNLQILCGSCNSRKQDRSQEEFEALCRKAGIQLLQEAA